ncbi:MAG: hypothetical protein V7694_26065, partial [Rhodococcus sp. (in: high G+C Gram-positive bacteria)]
GVATSGVLIEEEVGVLPWHVSRVSGMSVAKPSISWFDAQTRADANPEPHAGVALWDYAKSL